MRLRRLIATSVAATALLVAAWPTAAFAATFRIGTAGAQASVFTTSGKMKICDTRTDGRRAVMHAINMTTGDDLGYAEDANGNNGTSDADCTVKSLAAPVLSGNVIYIAVWIQDGAVAPQENFNSNLFYE